MLLYPRFFHTSVSFRGPWSPLWYHILALLNIHKKILIQKVCGNQRHNILLAEAHSWINKNLWRTIFYWPGHWKTDLLEIQVKYNYSRLWENETLNFRSFINSFTRINRKYILVRRKCMFLNRKASSSHHTAWKQTIPMQYIDEGTWILHVWHWKNTNEV